MTSSATINRRRAGRILKWLKKAGITESKVRTQIAVDLVDAVRAMATIKKELDALLSTDPSTKSGRTRAMTHAVSLKVWWSDELKYHVDRLHRNWTSKVEDTLIRRPSRRTSKTAA